MVQIIRDWSHSIHSVATEQPNTGMLCGFSAYYLEQLPKHSDGDICFGKQAESIGNIRFSNRRHNIS
jgi:hypothetical protein